MLAHVTRGPREQGELVAVRVARGHHLAEVARVPTGLEGGADGAGPSGGAADVGAAAVPGAALTAAGAHVGHVGGMVAGDEVVEADAVRFVAGVTQQRRVRESAEVMFPDPPVGGQHPDGGTAPAGEAAVSVFAEGSQPPGAGGPPQHLGFEPTAVGTPASPRAHPVGIYHRGATRPVPAEELTAAAGALRSRSWAGASWPRRSPRRARPMILSVRGVREPMCARPGCQPAAWGRGPARPGA